METIKINKKEYLLDIEKAKSQGLLKEKILRPMNWEEYCYKADQNPCEYNTFSTLNEAKAFVAFGKLIQLRDAWWGDWRPNWNNADEYKYSIVVLGLRVIGICSTSIAHTLVFPTEQMQDDFLETFRPLIEQAKMFL